MGISSEGDAANLCPALFPVLNKSDCALRDVLRRRQPGERLEFTNEVRLIRVSRIAGHARPRERGAALDLLIHLAESHHARESLWRQADAAIERPVETALAETQGRGDIAHGDTAACLAKESHGSRHNLIFTRDARWTQQRLDIRATQHGIDERLGASAPECIEGDALFCLNDPAHTEKRERRAGAKANADERRVLPTWGEQRGAHGADDERVRVRAEIDNDVGASVREDAVDSWSAI